MDQEDEKALLLELEMLFEQLKQKPPDVDLLTAIGCKCRYLKDPQSAEAYWRWAADVDPQSPWPCMYLGGLESECGRLSSALRQYEMALELMPDLGIACSFIAYIYERMGRGRLAELYHKKAVELDSGWVGAKLDLADFYVRAYCKPVGNGRPPRKTKAPFYFLAYERQRDPKDAPGGLQKRRRDQRKVREEERWENWDDQD